MPVRRRRFLDVHSRRYAFEASVVINICTLYYQMHSRLKFLIGGTDCRLVSSCYLSRKTQLGRPSQLGCAKYHLVMVIVAGLHRWMKRHSSTSVLLKSQVTTENVIEEHRTCGTSVPVSSWSTF